MAAALLLAALLSPVIAPARGGAEAVRGDLNGDGGSEVRGGTEPVRGDLNGDGSSEVRGGTEPVRGDLNGDGIARVAVVGDSIIEGAADEIEAALVSLGFEATVDTEVSRSTLAGVDPVRFYAAMGVDAIVVMLGANDGGDPEILRSRVTDVVAAAAGIPLLLWMSIPEVRSYYPAANQVLRDVVDARPGGQVLDWSSVAAADGVTAGDGLHLTPAGVDTMTGFVVSSLVAVMDASLQADRTESAAAPTDAPTDDGSSADADTDGARPGAGAGDGDLVASGVATAFVLVAYALAVGWTERARRRAKQTRPTSDHQ